jgi:hypothetical protein
MCEVCAIFGVGEHWSESAPIIDRVFPAVEIQNHRAGRRERIALLNEWVAADGLIVRDWDGEAFVVEDGAGRRRIANDLSMLWPVIEALAGRPFDPLQENVPFGPR